MRSLYKPKFLSPMDWSIYEADDANARRKLLHASLLTEAVLADLSGDIRLSGACLPWSKSWEMLRLRPGEVTLWSGYNGHKKSMLLGQLAVSLSSQAHRVVVASFEMAPHRTLARMVRQALKGIENLALIRETCEILRVWFYDQQGDATPAQVYALIRYAATLGIDHVVIDPLLKVVRGSDDYNGQKDFIAKLCSLAREYEMHIHIVAHSRKGANEFEAPRKLDVRGAGEITDQVDNVLTVWWNKRKQEKREAGLPIDQDDADLLLFCDKQRNGAWEGQIRLWFHPPSLQFCQDQTCTPVDLLGWGGPKSGRAALGMVDPRDAGMAQLAGREPGQEG